jgi:hypothetical protein
MTLPVVMPTNNSNAHKLEKDFPGRMALLMSPDGWRSPKALPYALDNGRYAVWEKGKEWDEALFWDMCSKAEQFERPPLWIVLPDVVGDASATEYEWLSWCVKFDKLRNNWRRALAVQDGMTPASVRRLPYQPDVIFVGGTRIWKYRTLWNWCRSFPRVHCARVNTEKHLWATHRCAVESTDGTGWFRAPERTAQLVRYLTKTRDGIALPQMELEFARTFGGKVPDESEVK